MRARLIKYLSETMGFTQINDTDQTLSRIDTWQSWYRGVVPEFHNYTIYNGTESLNCEMNRLTLPKFICESWASLLFNERCKIIVSDDMTQNFIKKVFDDNNFWIKLNEYQEQKCVYGTVCYIPYALINIDTETNEILDGYSIGMNYVNAKHMIPLSWNNGIITELAITTEHVSHGKTYIFAQLFYVDYTTKNYTIENMLFYADNNTFEQVALNTLQQYVSTVEKFDTGSNLKPFIIDKPNIVNNFQTNSPFGISVFANAIPHLKFCDTVFDSLINEFKLGKKRIMVSEEVTKRQIAGEPPIFDNKDIVFYKLPIDDTNKQLIQEINMTLRVSEHDEALQMGLNLVGSQVGMGTSFLRYENGGTKTATEVISEDTELYKNLHKHEIILEAVIVDLVRLIIYIGKNILKMNDINEDVDITVQFDDSIIEDKDAEYTKKLTLVNSGLMPKADFISWYFGLTIDEANKKILEINTQDFNDTNNILVDESIE